MVVGFKCILRGLTRPTAPSNIHLKTGFTLVQYSVELYTIAYEFSHSPYSNYFGRLCLVEWNKNKWKQIQVECPLVQ